MPFRKQDELRPVSEVYEPSELELAIEGAAEILRARARHPFSLGHEENTRTVAEAFEGWATHLLVRSPPPGSVGPRTTIARDWRGAVDFVERRAKKEQAWAQESVGGLRDAMFVLIQSLSQSSIAQGKRDAVLEQRLASLSAAIESGSVDALKHEARLVTAAIANAIAEQRRAAEEQAQMLRDQLESVGQELEAMRREGDTDPLTRLANRRVFDTGLARGLTVATVTRRPLSLLMVDVDHFKAVNDTHGHPNGDRALKAIADVLIRSFPRRTDLVVRYGGEEFAVLCEGPAGVAFGLATRLLEAVRATRVKLDDGVLALTISVGLAEATPNEAPADLVRRADRALYEAKHGGRDRCVIAR
jgi:diguanylate cyclase